MSVFNINTGEIARVVAEPYMRHIIQATDIIMTDRIY